MKREYVTVTLTKKQARAANYALYRTSFDDGQLFARKEKEALWILRGKIIVALGDPYFETP